MNSLLILNKRVGETPLACMERFRADHPEYRGVKMTYAGRLDPIASGVLPVLTGDRVHEKDSYLGLPKTYDCTALLGVSTDTYDVLGISDPSASQGLGASPYEAPSLENVKKSLEEFIGTFQQAYPPFSSKTVNGVQLHRIAREGRVEDVEIPERTVTVDRIWKVGVREISQGEISRRIAGIISLVSGDFRQAEIADAWNAFWKGSRCDRFVTVSFSVSVSGGTYIRGIVDSLGEKLGCGACVLSLDRTSVGEYALDQSDNP